MRPGAAPAAPPVSFLVPVRNEASFLGEALASVSGQTFPDFEAIVVDDGSSDGSAEIAEAHARDDGRFRVVRQASEGLVAALERGRAEARGRLLARLDGDDVALPGRLAAQVEALEEEGLTACGGRVESFPRAAVRDGRRRYERWLNGLVTPELAARDVFVECPLAHPALLVRRDAVEAVGGYRDAGWPEDYDLVLRLWAAGARFRNVEAVVLRWREHAGRRSRNEPAYAQEAFVRCKVHHLRATLLCGFESVVVWGAGPVGKGFARELRRCGVTVAAFAEVDPRKLGHEIDGAPVVPLADVRRYGASFVLGAVAGETARGEIRREAAALGRREGVDFVAVA
ncbi:MAG TPA: glycosyltransferase [Gaiellaceae bacterium]|nr:glycosyltransferase [Gaiellaceae bacterium]